VQHDTIFELVTTVAVGLLLGMAIRTLFFPSRLSPKQRRYTALMLIGSAAVVSSYIPVAAIGVVLVLFSVIMLARGAQADDHTSHGNRLLRLNDDELTWLNNALNEVCNGIAIDDAAFATRLGGSRQELRALLARVRAISQS
jgi:hypothetical protein